MVSIFLFILYFLFFLVCCSSDSYPFCGDCFCIPSNNGIDPCPYQDMPETSFSDLAVSIYQNQRALETYSLDCNPYTNASCTTSPPQTLLDSNTTVCALKYAKNKWNLLDNPSCTDYAMVTYSSRQAAQNDGAFVTHEGSCGLCSTTVDLALYLTQDFTDAGKKCATKGLFNESEGLNCYIALGLTYECAKIWNYDGIYDGKVCGATCSTTLNQPNNGPPPACEINACLECDEENAGPIFTKFAGRTRRRSGLLSEIIRPCSDIAKSIYHNPCLNSGCGC